MCTNWPARAVLASSGASYAWRNCPGRISRVSTSSAEKRRIPVPAWRRDGGGRLGGAATASLALAGGGQTVARVGSLGVGRRHRGERLRDRVGEVAEDVRRVVELDQLVGRGELAPGAVGALGDD